MKKSIALLFIIIGLQVSGQTTIDSIRKIEIVDYQNYDLDSMRGRTYQLVPLKDSVAVFNMNKLTGFELLEKLKNDNNIRYQKIQELISDSSARFKQEIEQLRIEYFLAPTKIECLPKDKVESLLVELERIPSKSIINELGFNKNVHKDHYLELFLEKRMPNVKLKESQQNYCLTQLQSSEILQNSAMKLIGKRAFSDYGYVSVKIFSKIDTLEFRTQGTNHFMLPWFNETKQISTYNPNISILLGSIINEDLNGKLLKGKDFNQDLYFYVIEEYCLTRQNRFKKK